MFALHESVRLKRDILEVLENTNEYISTKQLTNLLVYPSFNSVKQACAELKQQFKQFITKKMMTLEQVTTNIFDYLKILISKNQKQKLAILTYITTESINTYSHIPENILFQHTNSIIHPDKPDFLSHWSMSDWQFYVAFLYIYNLIDSQYNDRLVRKSEFLFEEAIQTWLVSFEKHLFPLFESEKKLQKFYR